MRYIYRVEDTESSSRGRELQDCLQLFGEQGFQAIDIREVSNTSNGIRYRIVFEKAVSS